MIGAGRHPRGRGQETAGPEAAGHGTGRQAEERELYSRDDPYVLTGLCVAPLMISIAYLGLSYGSSQFLCAVSSNSVMRGATIITGALLALFLARFAIAVFRRCFGGKTRRPFAPRRAFLVKTAATVGLLATFALLWSGTATILVSKCAAAAA